MKIIALFLVLASFFSFQTYAQEVEPVKVPPVKGLKNTIYIHPVELIASTFKLSYERAFGAKENSVMIVAGFLLREGTDTEESGASGEIHLRLTLLKIARTTKFGLKIYAAPFFKAQYIDRGYTEERCTLYSTGWNYTCLESVEIGHGSYIRSYAGGLVAGVKLTFVQKIAIGIYVGGQARYVDHSPFENENYESYFGEDIAPDILPFSLINEIENDPTRTGILPLVGFQFGFSF
ncbi:MAG: hypothetical protein COB85_05340 [Bacteroidetes bacterium]|nr:MAG: hypothetical protein COB85_05340 [Bacteroidota bacterium]